MALLPVPATPATPAVPAPAGPVVADALLHYLKLEGVTHVFGIPGGGLAHLLNAFMEVRDQIRYVICRHEGGAAYIADGYYRATGKLGVVMVTSGPGATNALTGFMNAQNDGSAQLLITGEVAQQFYGLGYLQEGTDATLNVDAIFAAAAAYSAQISAGVNAEALIKQALRDALTIPRQAVHLSIPDDVTVAPLPPTAHLPTVSAAYRALPGGAAREEVEQALRALTAAKHPVILLGNGCREAMRQHGAAFTRFVEHYGIPVMTTADGKGLFPESHPLSLRVYGVADCEWPYYWLTPPTDPAADPYDGLLVLGSSLGELSTNKWLPLLMPPAGGPFIQVDIKQSMIARSFPVTQGIVGEAGAFMRDMAKLLPRFPADEAVVAKRKAAVAAIKATYSPFKEPAQYASDARPSEPAALMRVLQAELPAEQDTRIFIDAGNCVGWSVHYLTVAAPWSLYTALSMGPMGFGVGAVIGAKLGVPAATCLAIVGDGAFLMHGAEVSTASAHGVGAIWLVLNDNDLAMVSQGMNNFFPDKHDPTVWSELYQLGQPDLVKFAEGLGADAYRVDSPAELAAVLPTVLAGANQANRPQVIVATVTRKSVPPYYDPAYEPAPPKAA